jgi:membrane protein DedA with SNARE-associated domain
MFDQIVDAIAQYPYIGVALVFLLCGLGLPLPEEIGLLAAGYVCAKFPDKATLQWMMVWCAAAIVAGDILPYVLGRVFGVRLLRLRWLRYLVTRQRLAMFDRWFRKRGDTVIFLARFLAGIRVVAFFTAGTMKMPWRRFLMLDGLGILLLVPALTWLGYRSATFIESVLATVQKVERGLLWGAIGASAAVLAGLWFWRKQRRRQSQTQPTETFVQPTEPVRQDAAPAAPAAVNAPTAVDAPATIDVPPTVHAPAPRPPHEPPPPV